MNRNLVISAQDDLPLSGKRIVITRARSQARSLAVALEARGGEVIEFPTIEIQPVPDLRALDEAIKNLHRYDWLMFTSTNGVEIFSERMVHLAVDLHSLAKVQCAAIGPETAKRLQAAGVTNCLVPRTYQAEGILEMLRPQAMRGKRILIPRAAKAREVLPATLMRWGADVEIIETYRTIVPQADTGELQQRLGQGMIDMVTFTSSSTVSNFARLFDGQRLTDILAETPVACIGPITENTVLELGGVTAVSAREFTIAGLVRAIVGYFRGDVPPT